MNRPCKTVSLRSLCLIVSCLLLLAYPPLAGAAEVAVQSDTIFRLFQRDTATKSDATVAPFFEYLQVDAGSLKERGLSLHLYGWGRSDLGGSGFYADDSSGELLYGYLEYSRPAGNLDLRLGRQSIFAGIASDSIDGLSLAADLGPLFSLSAFGGLPVAFDAVQGRSGDSIYGGRLAHRLGTRYELGLSYRQIANDGSSEDQRLGIDAALGLPAGISLSGRSSYNLESDGWGEHFYEARADLAGIALRPFFEMYDYRDYFAAGARTPDPFQVLTRSSEGLTAYGSDLFWRKLSAWDLGARIKFFDYQVNPESAAYYAALLTWHGQRSTEIGGELGRMQGEAANNDYLLGRLYVYWDQPAGRPALFVSGDLLYALYDQAIFGQDASFFASLGAGHRFLRDRFELKLSGDYSADPNFDSDWRGMLLARYRFGQ